MLGPPPAENPDGRWRPAKPTRTSCPDLGSRGRTIDRSHWAGVRRSLQELCAPGCPGTLSRAQGRTDGIASTTCPTRPLAAMRPANHPLVTGFAAAAKRRTVKHPVAHLDMRPVPGLNANVCSPWRRRDRSPRHQRCERIEYMTSDHRVAGSSPAGCRSSARADWQAILLLEI